jgi:hypothetical protein
MLGELTHFLLSITRRFVMLLRSFNEIRELGIMVGVVVVVMVVALSVAHQALVAVPAAEDFFAVKVVIVGVWSDRLRIPAQ